MDVDALIDRRLRLTRDSLGPRLRPGFDALVLRRGWMSGRAGHYTAPVSQPILVLPLLLAEVLGEAVPEASLAAALEGAMLGYGAVRVEDDWIDDGVGEEDAAATSLLSTALYAGHQAAMGRALIGAAPEPAQAYWELFARTWAAYAEAMVLERDLLRGPPAPPYDEARFAEVLLRSRPLVLPGAALLARADRLELLPPLTRLAHEATQASQLMDDAVDMLSDFEGGRMNHLVQRFGGLHGRQALLVGWALGGFAESLERADAALTRALAAAEELGCAAPFKAFVEGRRAVMARMRGDATETKG